MQIEVGGAENEETDTASEDEDTDAVIISENENETCTDADVTDDTEALEVFSDGGEETAVLADDVENVKPDFNVTLNGKVSKLEVTAAKVTESSKDWQVVNVTFDGADTNDTNTVSVNLPEGTKVTKTHVGKRSAYRNDSIGFANTKIHGDSEAGPFTAKVGDDLNSTSWYVVQIYEDGTHKYYKLNFHVNVEKSDLQGTVRLLMQTARTPNARLRAVKLQRQKTMCLHLIFRQRVQGRLRWVLHTTQARIRFLSRLL